MRSIKTYHVYVMTNMSHTAFYIGITNNLPRRVFEHKNKYIQGFTSRYNVIYLVYFEEYTDIEKAIKREKQLKNWHRDWKINLIKKSNPTLADLPIGISLVKSVRS